MRWFTLIWQCTNSRKYEVAILTLINFWLRSRTCSSAENDSGKINCFGRLYFDIIWHGSGEKLFIDNKLTLYLSGLFTGADSFT